VQAFEADRDYYLVTSPALAVDCQNTTDVMGIGHQLAIADAGADQTFPSPCQHTYHTYGVTAGAGHLDSVTIKSFSFAARRNKAVVPATFRNEESESP
jgi:hypothetical protein